MMRRTLSLVAILMIALGAVAWAAQKEQRRQVTFTEDVLVGGQLLKKGTYTVVYQPGVEGQATFMRGGKTVAQVPYKLVRLTQKATTDSITYRRTGPQPVLTRLTFAGQLEALEFEGGQE
ncbi:hypothetical protein HRbin10_01499 [bacterium HR10]|nr:hypothetical protein HRbin10_01499 [bacterium HR10]